VTSLQRLALWLVVGLTATAGAARAEGADSTAAARLVTAVGRGETEAAPDRAVVLLTVRAPGKTAGEASRTAAERSEKVLAALRGKLGTGDRADSAGTSLQPVYVYDQGKPPRITGYTAEHQLRATTAKIQEVGALLDAVTSAADVSIDSVVFELADPSPAQASALRLAAKDARVRAAAMADGLGLTLGAVRSIHEGGAPPMRPLEAERRFKAMAAEAPVQTQVLPPQLRFNGEVEVSFELSGGPRS
jgi:hypothetical protein